MLNSSGFQHAHRTFVGDVCNDRLFGQHAQRRFLRRNLRSILDAHERLVHPSALADRSLAKLTAATAAVSLSSGAAGARRSAMVANDRLPSGWDFPTPAMCEDLLRGQRPFLRVDKLQLQHPRSKSKLNTPPPQLDDEDVDADPDWLPMHFRARGRVTLTVFDPRQGGKKLIFQDHRCATIVERRQKDKDSLFDVALDSPFSVELFKLFVATETGSNGARHWKRTITAQYLLDIAIDCDDHDDGMALLSRIATRDPDSYRDLLPSDTTLKVTWDTLPHCPERGELLPLKCMEDRKPTHLPYAAEISIGWNSPRDSVLEQYNRQYWKPPSLLPTPSASDDLEINRQKVAITYKFQKGSDTRTHTVDELDCPFCENGLQYPSFDRLHLHLITDHEHFKVEVEGVSGEDDIANTINRTVSLSLHEAPSDRPPSPRDQWEWVAPKEPLNLHSELRGEQRTFLASTRPTKSDKRRGGKRAQHQDRDAASSTAAQAPQTRKRPLPDDVPDLPAPPVKYNPVPKLPGTRFFDARSKKQLKPGELVPNDDETPDILWPQQAHDASLARFGMRPAARGFHHAWDQHFSREQPSSSILTSEGIVRFVRVYWTNLKNRGEWNRQFWTKLDLLRRYGHVSSETYEYCLEKVGIDEDTGFDDEENHDDGRGRQDKGRQQRNDIADATPNGKRRARFDADNLLFIDGSEEAAQGRERAGAGGPVNGVGSESTNGDHATAAVARTGDEGEEREPTNGPTTSNGASKKSSRKPRRDPNCTACGKRAGGPNGVILCDNVKCPTSAYHMACMGLETRPPGWTCPQCSV